jgi:hypothetical protein
LTLLKSFTLTLSMEEDACELAPPNIWRQRNVTNGLPQWFKNVISWKRETMSSFTSEDLGWLPFNVIIQL